MIELSELNKIERDAIAMLATLATGTTLQVVQHLQPEPDDYARVFLGDAAERAREGFRSLWTAPPSNLARPGQTSVLAVATQAESLRTDNAFSQEFPGGYRRIADQLQPDRVWLRFTYVEPGQTSGMSYDGLVWLDGRWAWFPKPWRVLEASQDN